ncbi:MAG: site-specific DNA-methyltransferase [Phycisphaerales bacterium]|nr:site-specific DNA-methyltransferase [Phycisphaerales bacterium]
MLPPATASAPQHPIAVARGPKSRSARRRRNSRPPPHGRAPVAKKTRKAATGKASPSREKKGITQYEHADKKRVNIPPVGLVTPETDPIAPASQNRRTYQYDPHLDPQLVWAGKAERTSFEIPTVSLHVHERIDPKTIIQAVRTKNGSGPEQLPLFGRQEENPPLRDALDFYNHKKPLGWKNRLIAGDSLLVMNSLLEKEGLGGQVQMVYIDPPYGIRYGSNFQPFVNKRDVKDGSDDDLTLEPETLKAFRDTWELGIHSYLTYLRDRLLLAKELLHESGSCFVQISDENIHHVRELMDEVFGATNFCGMIAFQKTTSASGNLVPSVADFLVWYSRDIKQVKYRPLYLQRAGEGWVNYDYVRLPDGEHRRMEADERKSWKNLPQGSRVYRRDNLTSSRPAQEGDVRSFKFDGTEYAPGKGTFKTDRNGLTRLAHANRLEAYGTTLSYRRFADDFPHLPLNNVWTDTVTGGFVEHRYYVVQTTTKVLERCLLMTTDPGDLVLDPTCGSGTTAYVAEQWGRRWITTDTSRVAITLARQRLMTATFDYYTLAHPEQGVGSGFKYKTVPHVTLKSIANNPEIKEGMTREQIDRAIAKYADTETLYDQPDPDPKKVRVTGPFTVEAVPAAVFGQPEVRPIEPIEWDAQKALPGLEKEGYLQPDASISRQGETLRQSEWRAELFKTGIRAREGAKIEFVRLEALPGTRWLAADGETREDKPRRAVVSFGAEHAPLEQRQVAAALEEAQKLVPRPALVIFAALQFDPEAAKDIDETNWPGVTLLKAQMNGDLVTDDLKKKRSSNESFWLVGQPDIALRPAKEAGKFQVEVRGFDYYNPKSGKVESGGKANIAMWMLDTDYDGRSVYPRQVFFPMAGEKDGWARLAKNLKAEIDPDLIEQYRGTVSLPFERGKHGRVAVKIVDDRGIESLRLIEIEGAAR